MNTPRLVRRSGQADWTMIFRGAALVLLTIVLVLAMACDEVFQAEDAASGPHPSRSSPSSLAVAAICNGELASAVQCHAAGQGGLLANERFAYYVRGYVDWYSLQYSIDGGMVTTEPFLADLEPGRHFLQVRELPPSGDGVWSDPYEFTILPGALTITAFCDSSRGTVSTAAACRAAGARGLLAGEGLQWWIEGSNDLDATYFSIDGASATTKSGFTLRGLPPGGHTLRAMEPPPSGSGLWSAPYTFVVRPAPPSQSAVLPTADVDSNSGLFRQLLAAIPFGRGTICELLSWGVIGWLADYFAPGSSVIVETLAPAFANYLGCS